MEPSDIQPDATTRRPWTSRRTKILLTCAIGAAAAILSYYHGLTVTRRAGTTDWLAYVVPLLPDGLIGLSSAELYDAAQTRAGRPPAAVTGLVLGIVVTIVMNVASGWHYGWAGRLLNALAPVALIIAVWVLEVGLRRPLAAPAPADPPVCIHQVPPGASQQEQVVTAFLHGRDCLGVEPKWRELGRTFDIHHNTARKLVAAGLAGPSLNGAAS